MQTTPELMIFTVIVLILSVIIHEVAHGYAANALGDPTARLAGRLTLNPIPHIDVMGSLVIPGLLVLTGSGLLFGWAKPVPYNPYNLKDKRFGETFVAIAGVATNILLAIIFVLIARVASGAGMEEFIPLALTIAWINLFLGLFNLIPFPPLDGFSVLRSLLPYPASATLMRWEMHLSSPVALVAFLLVFSYVFAGPFASFVRMVFELLVS